MSEDQNIVFFSNFINDNFRLSDKAYLYVPIRQLENGKMIGCKSNLSIEELRQVYEVGFVKLEKTTYTTISLGEATHYELRLRHTDNIICVDVDGIKANGDCSVEQLMDLECLKDLFASCPYTLSRKKKLPHFYFKVVGLDTQTTKPTYQDIFKDFKGDILTNHSWEKIHNNPIFNYEKGLPVIDYKDLVKLCKKPLVVQTDMVLYEAEILVDDLSAYDDPNPSKKNKPKNKPKKESTLVSAILNLISPDYLTGYGEWSKIMWACKNCGVSKETAIKISEKAENFTMSGFENVWNGDYPAYTIGTLKYYAKLSNPTEYGEMIQQQFDLGASHTDYSWATLFHQLSGDNFICQDGELYVYHNNKWRNDRDKRFVKKQIQDTLITFLNDYKKRNLNETIDKEDIEEYEKIAKQFGSCMKTICTISQVQHITENFITIIGGEQADLKNVFDDKPYIFCFSNKSYDLQLGTEIVVKKEDYIIENTSYDYVEPTDEQYKTIEKLFIQIFPNPEIRKCYLSVLFMGMTGIQVEKFFLANGCGRNGKGLINDLYAKMLGNDYYYKLSADVLTSKSDLSKGANPQVANMDNKRCIISSEPDDDAQTKIRMNIIKEITGCGEINARQLYSSKTIVRMKQVQILECNKKPQLSGRMDPAVMDRIIDIPFESYFTANEDEWDDKAHIYPIDSYYKSSGFQSSHKTALFKYIMTTAPKTLYIPIIIKERSKKYVMNNDEMYDWMSENYEATNDENDILKMKDVYNIFRDSELFCSKTKEQKRGLNYKGFIEYMSTSIAFKGKYKNDMRKINGVTYTERIIKYKLKPKEPEEHISLIEDC